jgi:hypothetical protein
VNKKPHMNEGTGTYTRGLRNGANAYRRFYEPGVSSVEDRGKQSILRRLAGIVLALALGLGLLGFLTTYL